MKILFLCFLMLSFLACSSSALKEKQASEKQKFNQETTEQKQQLEDLARQAYSFGFPLILSQATKDATSPKYWFDLSQGPVMINVPSAGKRYYIGNIYDGWTNIVGSIGTKNTNNKAGNYVVVGPQWTGELPNNAKVIASPTDLAWFSVQIYNNGSAKDMAAAQNLRSRFRITQASRSEGEMIDRSLASNEASATQDMMAIADSVFAMDAATYYHQLCALMVKNPPSQNDNDFMTKLQALGLQPGEDFDFAKLNPVVQQALTASLENSKDYMMAHQGELGPSEPINGWIVHTNATDFGTDYDRRAFVALTAMGTPRAQDEMIFSISADNLGQRLSSIYRYQVTFAKGKYPPTQAGWTLTTEGAPTRTISNSRHYKRNADGSLTLYIQKDNPGKARVSNWLPAPQGEFDISLRLFQPKQEAVNLNWEPPTVEHVIETSPLVMEQSLTLHHAL